MSSDDIWTLDTIYSPKFGGTCAFPTSYEATCSPACTRISATSVAGHCCWCNSSTPKTYVQSSWSAVTYLCQ